VIDLNFPFGLTRPEVARMAERIETWNRLQRLLELLDKCRRGSFSVATYLKTDTWILELCVEDVIPYVMEEADA